MKFFAIFIYLFALCGCHSSTPQKGPAEQILRTSLGTDIVSFDPRKGVSMHNQAVVRMLFTGLVRLDEQMTPQMELAESYQVSADFKRYTFKMRKCHWSDGSLITAKDFENTWKAALTPSYASANTNLFFNLKNGEKAFLGQLPTSSLGVEAIDDETLVIDLEEPNPRFLEILVNSIFSPVHRTMQTSAVNEKELITSGPFVLNKYLFQDRIILEKNIRYWNKDTVQLHQLHYYIIKDQATALLMFEKQELDWLGEPTSRIPTDSIPTLKKTKNLRTCPIAGQQWMFLNTTRVPFNNIHIRKALAYAIERKMIMQDVMHLDDPTPLIGLIPQALKRDQPIISTDYSLNRIYAKELFAQGLKELGICADEFPVITINYSTSTKAIAAIQQMWEETLGIKVKIENIDGPILVRKIYDQDFQIIWSGWVVQYYDPSNALEIFKLKNVQPNYTGWENQDFIYHTTLSHSAISEADKWSHVEQAEQIFLSEMPSIPITNMTIFYLQQPYVKNVSINSLLLVDFDRAFIDKTSLY
ncbi:MAG: peptide ABC transporter substrate-binding protein [Candidatus Rhabdochlamydia sp.]